MSLGLVISAESGMCFVDCKMCRNTECTRNGTLTMHHVCQDFCKVSLLDAAPPIRLTKNQATQHCHEKCKSSPGNLWHVQTRTLRYAFGKNLEKYAQILRPKDPGRSTVGKSEKTLKKRNILKQLSQIVPVSWVWYPFSPLHSTMRKQGPPRAATMNDHFQTGNNYC